MRFHYCKYFLFAIIVVLITVPLVLARFEQTFVVDQTPSKADVIVVLGCSVNSDGSPSDCMRGRVAKAHQLWKDGYAQYFIVSGSAVRNQFIEAHVMQSLLVEYGVAHTQIIAETNARNTIENITFSSQIMRDRDWSTAIVVTSPHHTARALRLFSERRDVKLAAVVASQSVWKMSIRSRVRAVMHELGARG